MRVLICGGREFDDWLKVQETMHLLKFRVTEVIQGGAKGADFLGRVWAKVYDIPCREFPADWRAHGKRAGHIRNQQMLDEGKPDWVIAFPGGRGTEDMMRRAGEAGIPVHVVAPTPPEDSE